MLKNILNVRDNTTRVEAHTQANVQWDHSSRAKLEAEDCERHKT